MKINKFLVLSSLVLPNLLFTQAAHAHGWTSYPNARQSICNEDGGYWTGTIPNQACQAAFDMSGTFPFVQRNEIATNITQYRDITALKAAVPDGTLCAAGRESYAGLNIPSPHWQKTAITLDANNQFAFAFRATAPHHPSYWEFYLSKESFDHSRPLTWDDIELVDSAVNLVAGSDGYYRTNVTLPAGRTGDAIFFTRWQRDDPAGEGFYNCSDITFSDAGSDPSDPIEPGEPDGNYLNDLGAFIPSDFIGIEAGDTVRFRTFDSNGNETTDTQVTLSAADVSNWAAVLAGRFNEENPTNWFIGIWHEEMSHYMFDTNNIYANRVFAATTSASYQLSLIKYTDPLPPVEDESTWDPSVIYQYPDTVKHAGASWQAHWWTRGEEPGTTGQWGVWRPIAE